MVFIPNMWFCFPPKYRNISLNKIYRDDSGNTAEVEGRKPKELSAPVQQ